MINTLVLEFAKVAVAKSNIFEKLTGRLLWDLFDFSLSTNLLTELLTLFFFLKPKKKKKNCGVEREGREDGNGIGFSHFERPFSKINHYRVTFQASCFDFQQLASIGAYIHSKIFFSILQLFFFFNVFHKIASRFLKWSIYFKFSLFIFIFLDVGYIFLRFFF